MIDRLNLDGSRQPNFIGCWMMKNTSICDNLIEFFEYGKNTKRPGVVADGVPRETVRKSTDISILPHDLKGESFRDVSSYIEH